MTEKEMTSALVELFPTLAYWDESLGMFVWYENRDEEIREFLPCSDLLAITAVEGKLKGFIKQTIYPRLLVRVTRSLEKALESDKSEAYWVLTATPRMRAEAILLAHGIADGADTSGDSPTGTFVISINDGYVEYSCPWELSSDYSIGDICRCLEMALGCPPSGPLTVREPSVQQ